MLKKLFLFALLAIFSLAIKSRGSHLLDHDLFGSKPNNPKNRTETQVCEHYNGKMCNVPLVGPKCCKDGLISKNTHCDTIGCENDTLSISDMSWDY